MGVLEFFDVKYNIVRDGEDTLELERGGEVIMIDKTSDRYLAIYRQDYDFRLSSPAWVDVNFKAKTLTKKHTRWKSIKRELEALPKYKRDIFIKKLLSSDTLSKEMRDLVKNAQSK